VTNLHSIITTASSTTPIYPALSPWSVPPPGPCRVHEFRAAACRRISGHAIRISDFYERFAQWVGEVEATHWGHRRIESLMLPEFPKGRRLPDSQWAFGNLAWVWEPVEPRPPLVLIGDLLRPEGWERR